jgi:hypothetical protein
MIHRALDNNGDWFFGKGRNSFDAGAKAIMTNIKTRLLSFKDDCFFDADAGVDWWNMPDYKDKKAFIYQVRAVIMQSYGVARLTDLDASFSQNRVLSLNYSVETIYKERLSDNTEILQYA